MADRDAQRQMRPRVAFVTAAVLLMAASFVIMRTGRDALYFMEGGLLDLPKAYIGIAVLSVPVAFTMLALMRALGPRTARVVAPLGFALLLAVASGYAAPGGGPFMTGLFMIIPLGYGVIFSLSWLLAADLLDGAAPAVLAPAYGVIGAGSILGGVAGGLAARAASAWISPRGLLWVGAAVLALSALCMLAAQIRYPAHRIATPPRVATFGDRGVRGIFKQRAALLLLCVAMAAALTSIFVEFQFYLAAATSGNDGRENASFFAGFYTVLNVGALVMQVLVLPRLQRWLGVHGSLLIMPVAILSGAAMLVGSTSLVLRSGLRLTEGGLKASIQRSSWEQAFLSLSPAQRAAAKVLIDGAGARVAEGVAAIALQVWLVTAVGDGQLVGRSTSWMGYAMVGGAGAWFWLTWVLARRMKADHVVSEQLRIDLPLPDT